jgi:NAD(P)H-hydrate repair Nnr-like enzyme with NAD(P)H-hydrate epimerase domain
MGTVYPDLLGRCLARPEADDGISDDRIASAVVVAESVGMALATTAAFAWIGGAGGDAGDALARARLLYLALLPVAVVMVRRLVAASRSAAGRPVASA